MAIELSEKQIKDGWQIVKFGEIAKNISKRVEPSETDLEVYVGLEHLDPQSLRITRRGVPADVKGQKLRVRPGQIIFGKRRAYQKKVAVADFEGICSAHAMVLEEVVDKIIPGLLPFFMQSDMFMDRAVAISEGSLSPTIKWKTLAIQEFPLPPIERQKEILEVLKKVEENSKSVISFKNTVDGLIRATITHIIDDKKFPLEPLSSLTVSSAFGPLYPSSLYSNDGNIGTIRTTDFTDDSRINYSAIPFARLDEKKFAGHFLKSGDLLITRSGTIGQVGVFEEQQKPVIAGAFQIRFRLNNQIIPRFAQFVLLHPRYQRKMQVLSNGGVQKNITSKSILNIQLPVPPIDVQQSIVKSIVEAEKIADGLLGKVDILKNISSMVVSHSTGGVQ